MTNLLKPKEILADKLNPRILLKVESLRGPIAWDYNSLAEVTRNGVNGPHSNVRFFTDPDRIITPCGFSSNYLIELINNNSNMCSVQRMGECLIGIKALRPVKFEIHAKSGLEPMHNYIIGTINLDAGAYKDSLVSGYPIALSQLQYTDVYFQFSQGSMCDLELVYSYMFDMYRFYLRYSNFVIPYISSEHKDTSTSLNIVHFNGYLHIMNQDKTIKTLHES